MSEVGVTRVQFYHHEDRLVFEMKFSDGTMQRCSFETEDGTIPVLGMLCMLKSMERIVVSKYNPVSVRQSV